jgi:hypothetical protein
MQLRRKAWRGWKSFGDNAARVAAIPPVLSLLATIAAGLAGRSLALHWQILVIVILGGLVITISSAMVVLAFSLRGEHTNSQTLNELLKESFVVLDSLLVISLGETGLRDVGRLTSCLYAYMQWAYDHIARHRETALVFHLYDAERDGFIKVARWPVQSPGHSPTPNMRMSNCLAGRALQDGDIKHYPDVTSEDARNGGFNNGLGRSLEGSIIVVPLFSPADDRPLGTLSCHCKEIDAFTAGDVQLLRLLGGRVQVVNALFGGGQAIDVARGVHGGGQARAKSGQIGTSQPG